MTVDAPNHGASRRAAAISAPRDAAPTTAATIWIRRAGIGVPQRSAARRGGRRGPTAGRSSVAAMTRDLADLDRRVLWHPFTQQQAWREEDFPVIDRADGAMLYDTAGTAYIDGVSSLWCTVHGHRHPAIDIAVKDPLDRVAHSTMLGLAHAPAIELAERLLAVAPAGLSRVFYSDNGSTACE